MFQESLSEFQQLLQAMPEKSPRSPSLVGAGVATGDRIFATGSDTVSKCVFAILCLFLLDFRAYNHGVKGPQHPRTYCDNKLSAILSFTSIFTVRSGAMWQQDLVILSPESDSTFQLRLGEWPFHCESVLLRMGKWDHPPGFLQS